MLLLFSFLVVFYCFVCRSLERKLEWERKLEEKELITSLVLCVLRDSLPSVPYILTASCSSTHSLPWLSMRANLICGCGDLKCLRLSHK